jgi:hypothetical protein
VNSGDFTVTSTRLYAFGIFAETFNGSGPLSIVNSGGFGVTAANYAFGIFAQTTGGNSALGIENRGDLTVTSNLKNAIGIDALTYGNSPLSIENSGNGVTQAIGIFAKTHDGYSPIDIENSGDFTVSNAVRPASGIYGRRQQPY